MLTSPTSGISNNIQVSAKITPGMAIGSSMTTQAAPRNGISLRSMSQANSTAVARPPAAGAITENSAVLKNAPGRKTDY